LSPGPVTFHAALKLLVVQSTEVELI